MPVVENGPRRPCCPQQERADGAGRAACLRVYSGVGERGQAEIATDNG